MSDERKEASLLPMPGGDVRIWAYSFALCVGTCGVFAVFILWLIPEGDRSHAVVGALTGLSTSLPAWLAYLKGHANGNATQEVKDTLRLNNVMTAAVAEKVAPEKLVELPPVPVPEGTPP